MFVIIRVSPVSFSYYRTSNMDDNTETAMVKINTMENESPGLAKNLSKSEKSHNNLKNLESGTSWTGLKSLLSQRFDMGPTGFFMKMCKTTSVHGFGLIGMAIEDAQETIKAAKEEGTKGKKETSFWAITFAYLKVIVTILILLASFGCLCYYMVGTYDDYMSTYLSIGLRDPQADLSRAYFPDVTICNNNLIKMSFLTSIDPDLHKQTKEKKKLRKDIQEYFVTGSNGTASKELNTFIKKPEFVTKIQEALPHKKHMITQKNAVNFFRQAAVPTCKDMIVMMYWRNQVREKFTLSDSDSTEATNFGICCNISPTKLFPNDTNTKDMEGGPNEGISLLIDSQNWDFTYSRHYSEGFRISTSKPNTFNRVEQNGVFIWSGTNTYASLVTKVLEIGSDRPMSYNWSPKEKTCFTGDMDLMPGMTELQKKYPRLKKDTQVISSEYGNFVTYDYRLCRELVKLDKIMTHSKCIPPEYWEILNTDYNTTKLPDMEPCLGPKIKKSNQVLTKLSKDIKSREDSICLRNCVSQENWLYQSFSEYPAATFEDFPEYEIIQSRINEAYKDPKKKELMNKYFSKKPDPRTYTKKNLSWLTVYFQFPYVKAYSVDVVKTRHAVLAEVGGFGGLCLGISLIGVIELLVHAFKIFMGLVTPKKNPIESYSA